MNQQTHSNMTLRMLGILLLVVVLGLGAAGPSCSLPFPQPPAPGPAPEPPAPGPATGNAVAFVYFVEADQPYRPEIANAIRDQAYALQRFWYDQFGGTFQLNNPVVTVISGARNAAWYDRTPDGIHSDPRWYRLGNISNEVRAAMGTNRLRFVSYPASTVTEPRVGANFGGAWMDGDDALCIIGEAPSFPYPDGNEANCLGHVAHEFGHVYGLDHEGPDSDCMQYGFYDERNLCGFSSSNRRKVQQAQMNQGWLDYRPGAVRNRAQSN